jgi:hypothetical protein
LPDQLTPEPAWLRHLRSPKVSPDRLGWAKVWAKVFA